MTIEPGPAGPVQPRRADPNQPEPADVTQPVRPRSPGAAAAAGLGTQPGSEAGPTWSGAATPQDAPLDRPWAGPAVPTVPAPAPGMAPTPQPARRVVPAPTGANWALVVVALLLVLAAAAEIAYLLGFRADGTMQIGPGVLIGAGGLLVLVGLAGLLGQRRSRPAGARRQPDGDRG